MINSKNIPMILTDISLQKIIGTWTWDFPVRAENRSYCVRLVTNNKGYYGYQTPIHHYLCTST